MSQEREYDVVIVGAGPVGLATAIALHKRSIDNILVIDQTRKFRRVGQVIDLLPNGLKSIKYISPDAYQQVKETAFQSLNSPLRNNAPSNSNESEVKETKVPPKKQWHHKNLQGEITSSVDLDFDSWFNRYGEGRISMSWYDLQTTLRNVLPAELIQANHRCINVEQNLAEVYLDCISDTTITNNPFAHREMDISNSNELDISENRQEDCHKRFRAKLVIAADGINSTVRQIIYAETDLQEFAKPKYSGFVAISCSQIEAIPNAIREELESKYFQGDRVITLSNDAITSTNIDLQGLDQLRIILFCKPDQSMGYLLHTPLGLEAFQNKQPSEIINLGIECLKNAGFPPVFANLLNLSNPEKLIHRPYYIHPVNMPSARQPVWSCGRVVLVGDAAHGMPPFMAQGANQGLEDAALISSLITKLIQDHCLDDEQAIAKAFRKYEEVRVPLMIKIQEATMKNNHWSQQQWEQYSEMVYSRDYSSNYLQ